MAHSEMLCTTVVRFMLQRLFLATAAKIEANGGGECAINSKTVLRGAEKPLLSGPRALIYKLAA
jgi:hypothetical protein